MKEGFVMWNAALTALFSSGYIPHGNCYAWQPPLVSLHAISDISIASAFNNGPCDAGR